ncbi:MAG: AMP-binding protein [Candidatus Babeliales bacterium]|jgi:long-chain acyl-CoA synthetase
MLNESRIFQTYKEIFSDNGKLMYAGMLLKRAYELFHDNVALEASDRTVTYRELFYRTLCLGETLKRHGVKPRDKVALLYENSPEFFVAYFAIWQCGAVVVPLNTFLHPKELAYIINDAAPSVLIVSPTHKKSCDALSAEAVATMPMILSNEIFDWQTPVPECIDDVARHFEICELDLDELCALLYTSGTTGTPKGVMLSSRNVMTNALQDYTRFTLLGMATHERFFCVLPLFHVFAQNTCLWLPMMVGATVIIVTRIERSLILDGLRKKPTLFFGMPALYGLLCLMKKAPLDSVKMFISGADMLPAKISSLFSIVYGRKISPGYGLSEAAPVVAVNHENYNSSTIVVGLPVVGLSCEIRDDAGTVCEPDTIGTLWLKGDNVMLGYYQAPHLTQQVLVDGWLNTGDLASIDTSGRLAIHGRTKDVIIHKGFNIYPAEVENVLLMHPSVFRAAVIGNSDPLTGQIPVAFVAAKVRDEKLEKDLRALCVRNLAAYKIPRTFVCCDDLPVNATGKVDKKQLRATLDKGI